MKYCVNIDTNCFHRIPIIKEFNFTIAPIFWAFFSKFSVFIFDQSLNSLLPFKKGFFENIVCGQIGIFEQGETIVEVDKCLPTTRIMCIGTTQYMPWSRMYYVPMYHTFTALVPYGLYSKPIF